MRIAPPSSPTRVIGGRVALVAAVLSAGGPLAAQDCPAPADESQESVAQSLNLAGQHDAALERFVSLQRSCPSPRTLARLALTEAALGRWVSADAHLREALAADHPWIAARRRELGVEADHIAEHLGEILVTGPGPRGDVFVDDRRVGDWPMSSPLRVPVGTVRVRVECPGCTPVERAVQIRSGILAREELTPFTLPTAPPRASTTPPVASRAATAPPRDGRLAWRVVGWSALGVGLAALGTGAALMFARSDAITSLGAEGCGGGAPPVNRCEALADQADANGTAAAVGLAVGGALTALSAGVLVTQALRGAPRSAGWLCLPVARPASAQCAWSF